MKEFNGKTAVVTGAASGIGLAMAELFLANGMNVVMADIEAGTLDTAANSLAGGDKVLAVVSDVADSASVDQLAEQAYSHFGNVHLLCNNARWRQLGVFRRRLPLVARCQCIGYRQWYSQFCAENDCRGRRGAYC